MKSYLLTCLLAIFSFSILCNTLSAQTCNSDMIYADSAVGVYPTSITDTACINSYFSFDLTFNIPETVTLTNGEVAIDSIVLTSVTGLPAGMAYATNPPSGIFIPADGLACANIYGAAESSNSIGDYELFLNGTITVAVFGDIPLSTLFSTLGVENYILTLVEEGSPSCTISSAVETLTSGIEIETAPNPFSSETTISITSEKVNTDLILEVYTMLGERVHAEKINLSYGNNVITYDGAHLAEGIYFFNFSDGNSMLTQKIIVQR